MPLDINGYSDTFRAFTDFAKVMTEGKGGMNSIARVETGVDITTGALAGRTITAAQGDSLRHMFKWTRSEENQAANNITRDLFKNAIINMFGGEKNIPKSVQKAMLMSDYGKIILIGGLPFKGLEIEEFCKDLDEFVGKAEEWRETVENFRPAAEEAAVRDEEAARFMKFGGNGPGFMSV